MLCSLTAALGRIYEIRQSIDSLQNRSATAAATTASTATTDAALSQGKTDSFAQVLTQAQAQPVASTRTPLSVQSPDRHFSALIAQAAKRYGVDEDLVHAVVHAESDYDPTCKSHCGAMGLMQPMPENVKELGVKDPWDPAQNLDAGVRQLRQQLDRFKDVDLALAAYNAGPGAVRKYGGIPPYRETQGYVKHVLQTLWQRKGH